MMPWDGLESPTGRGDLDYFAWTEHQAHRYVYERWRTEHVLRAHLHQEDQVQAMRQGDVKST